MKVFVTGATGYVGSAVAQALLAVGNRVSSLARSEEAARKLEDAGVDPVRGSLTDAAVIAAGPALLVAWRPAHEQRVLTEAGHGIVIRPAVVYGQGGGMIADMVKQAQATGTVRYVGTGEQHWTVIHVEDLADLYVLALETAPAGSVFLAANDEAPTLREIAQAVSEAAGASGQTQPWPQEDARRALGPFADALALDQKVTKAATLFADLSEASALH